MSVVDGIAVSKATLHPDGHITVAARIPARVVASWGMETPTLLKLLDAGVDHEVLRFVTNCTFNKFDTFADSYRASQMLNSWENTCDLLAKFERDEELY